MAAFDVARISGYLEVRYAAGSEVYSNLSSEMEHADHGEVISADAEGRAHARRWTNRQSGHSVVRSQTTDVLIVAEAMHSSAHADIQKLESAMVDELRPFGHLILGLRF